MKKVQYPYTFFLYSWTSSLISWDWFFINCINFLIRVAAVLLDLTKNLSTFEGGAIAIHPITKSKEKVIRSIISYGRNESGEFSRFGFNGRMSAQSALTGYAQLKMHKNQVVSSIGEYNEENGFYPYLTYEHEFIKKLGIHGDCPVAEKVSKWIKEKRKSYW